MLVNLSISEFWQAKYVVFFQLLTCSGYFGMYMALLRNIVCVCVGVQKQLRSMSRHCGMELCLVLWK